MFHGMWDPSRSSIKPRSSALVSRFFITEPPRKPWDLVFESIQPLCLLFGSFRTFIFKVIIDICVLIAIMLAVFWIHLEVIFYSFFFFLSLMIWCLSLLACLNSFCILCVYLLFFFYLWISWSLCDQPIQGYF